MGQYYFDRITAKQQDATKVEISGFLNRYGPALPVSGKRIGISNTITGRTKYATTNSSGWFGIYFFTNELNSGNNQFVLMGGDATLTKSVSFTSGTVSPSITPPIGRTGNLTVTVRSGTVGLSTYGTKVSIRGPSTQSKTFRTSSVTFSNIPIGSYEITISKTGCDTKTGRSTVVAYQTSRQTLTIKKTALQKGILTLEVRATGIMANAIGARISIYRTGTSTKVAEKTNYVTLTKFTLEPGRYDVIITKIGYRQDGILRVDIPAGREIVKIATMTKGETAPSAASYPTNIYSDIPGVKLVLKQAGVTTKTLSTSNPISYVTTLATKASFLGKATLTENKSYTAYLTHLTIPSVSKTYTFTFNKNMYYKGIYLPLGLKCIGKLKANLPRPTLPAGKSTPEKVLLNIALEPVPGAPAPESVTVEIYIDGVKVTEVNVAPNKPKQPDILPSILSKFDPITFFRSGHVVLLNTTDTPCNITPSAVTLTLPSLLPSVSGVCKIVADTINFPLNLDFSMPLTIKNPRIDCASIETRGMKLLATFKLGPYTAQQMINQGEDVNVDLADIIQRSSGQDLLTVLKSIHSMLTVDLTATRGTPSHPEPVQGVNKLTKTTALSDRTGLRTELNNLSMGDIPGIESAASHGMDELYLLLAELMAARDVSGYIPPTTTTPLATGLCTINPKVNLPSSFDPTSPVSRLSVEISNAVWSCPGGGIDYPNVAYVDTPTGTVEVPLTNGVGRLDLTEHYAGDLWRKPASLTNTGVFNIGTSVAGAAPTTIITPELPIYNDYYDSAVDRVEEYTPEEVYEEYIPEDVLPEAYVYADGDFTVEAIDDATGASLDVSFRIDGFKGFSTPASFTFGSTTNNIYDWKVGVIRPDRTYTIWLDQVPDTYEPVMQKSVKPSNNPNLVFRLKSKVAAGSPITASAHKSDGSTMNIKTALNYITPILEQIPGVTYVKRSQGSLTPITVYLKDGTYTLTPTTDVDELTTPKSVSVVMPRDAGKTIDFLYKDKYAGGKAILNVTTDKQNIFGYVGMYLNGELVYIHKGRFPAVVNVPVIPGTNTTQISIGAYEVSPEGVVTKKGYKFTAIRTDQEDTTTLPTLRVVSGSKKLYTMGPKTGQWGQVDQVAYEERVLM